MDNGKDMIFAMGAPGSRWSGILRAIQMYHNCINHSDDSPERKYDRYTKTSFDGKEVSAGWHRGAYWGPAHEFGQGFDDIKSNYTKETFLQECKKPFENWNGVKIIKSHWFAYNIKTLKERGGIHFISPVAGEMACGETGTGRLREPQEILQAIIKHFQKNNVH